MKDHVAAFHQADGLAREVLDLARSTLLVHLRFLDLALSRFTPVSYPGTLATDQRGVQRNLDGRACIGAFEYTDEGSFLPGTTPDGDMVQLAGKQLLVNAPADFTCTVYDLQGKPHLTGAHAAHDHVIDIAHLPQGAYIVRIDTPARHEALKIIL